MLLEEKIYRKAYAIYKSPAHSKSDAISQIIKIILEKPSEEILEDLGQNDFLDSICYANHLSSGQCDEFFSVFNFVFSEL